MDDLEQKIKNPILLFTSKKNNKFNIRRNIFMKIKVNSEKNVNYNQSSVDSCSHSLKSN